MREKFIVILVLYQTNSSPDRWFSHLRKLKMSICDEGREKQAAPRAA
jgi:hypothetical protein